MSEKNILLSRSTRSLFSPFLFRGCCELWITPLSLSFLFFDFITKPMLYEVQMAESDELALILLGVDLSNINS